MTTPGLTHSPYTMRCTCPACFALADDANIAHCASATVLPLCVRALWCRYHDARRWRHGRRSEDQRWYFRRWTQDAGVHFTARGDDIAAALLLHWVDRVMSEPIRPIGAPTRPDWWAAAPGDTDAAGLNTPPAVRVCYSFDDRLGGRMDEPLLLPGSYGWTRAECVRRPANETWHVSSP